MSITHAFHPLNHIQQPTLTIKFSDNSLATPLISLTFLYLHPPNFQNILITFIAPLLPFLILQSIQTKSTTIFIPQFLASFLIPLILLLPTQLFNIHQTIPPSFIPSIIPILPPLL
ncbi:threonine/serine exporter family protein, partial [Staphylococcus saprophyticus]|uniref:threonine/serine exporter family protein n=1 Tax=Staphylococcus saprophyticus TaxID=29385 RepID=UPI0028CB7E93